MEIFWYLVGWARSKLWSRRACGYHQQHPEWPFKCSFHCFTGKWSVSQSIYTSYKQFISCSKYPMFLFWSSYIEIVCLLLKFVRAPREGNWNLHLSCIRDMLPWVTAYDRINYSRYLPIYWCQMNTLSETHPQAQHYLHSGEFAVQRVRMFHSPKWQLIIQLSKH